MSSRIIRIVTSICALLVAGNSLRAQDGADSQYSPYTVFGVGDLYTQGTSYDKSKGGVGIASRNVRFINYLNPAAVTARDTLSFMFDFGLLSENKVFEQNKLKSANNTFNINDIVFSVPIYKKLAFMGGITPFSTVAYDFSHDIVDPSIIGRTGNIKYSAEGNGSLYQIFGDLGYEVINGLSIGVGAMYIFGNIDKNTQMGFTDETYRTIDSGYKLQLNAMAVNFGVQWEKRLSPSLTMVLGATYRPRTKLKGYVTDFQYATVSSVRDTIRNNVDTLGHIGRAKLGDELGIGIAIRGNNKWSVELDYTRSDWGSTGMDTEVGFANVGNSVFSTGVSQSWRAGFEIVPNRNDIRYFMRRCSYRAGAYYNTSYYKLDGSTIGRAGITLGMTIPVFRWYNGLSVGVDLGQKGNLDGNKTRERYALVTIGFNIHDLWFQKPRYE